MYATLTSAVRQQHLSIPMNKYIHDMITYNFGFSLQLTPAKSHSPHCKPFTSSQFKKRRWPQTRKQNIGMSPLLLQILNSYLRVLNVCLSAKPTTNINILLQYPLTVQIVTHQLVNTPAISLKLIRRSLKPNQLFTIHGPLGKLIQSFQFE